MSEDRTMYGHPQYPAFLRRVADLCGGDLSDAQGLVTDQTLRGPHGSAAISRAMLDQFPADTDDLDSLATDIRSHGNPALADRRNAYGFPFQTHSAPVDDYADWSPQDIAARDDMAARTYRAMSHYLTRSEASWVAEEVLAQIGYALRADGTVHIPMVGTLTLAGGVLSVQAAPGLDLTRGGLSHE